MTTPEVVITSSGPAVVHADSTLVSVARPAKAGEVVTIYALGLGPIRGTVPFGTTFPQSPALVVGPVDVLANGLPAEVLYSGGYPGTIDGYQINLRLPAGLAPGTAELKIRSAWIEGSSDLIVIG